MDAEELLRNWQKEPEVFRGQVTRHDADTGVTQRVRWQDALTDRDNRIKAQVVEVPAFDLPAVRKRTHDERLKSMTDKLVEEAQRTKRLFGFTVLPGEIMEQIHGEMWRFGKPVTREELETYAKGQLEQAERRQKARDGRFVTTPSRND